MIPLVIGTALTLILYLKYPEMSPFDLDAEYTGSFRELAAVYSGRIVMTSAYLLIFAIIDIPILKRTDSKTDEDDKK